jgi:hypothetical protein
LPSPRLTLPPPLSPSSFPKEELLLLLADCVVAC